MKNFKFRTYTERFTVYLIIGLLYRLSFYDKISDDTVNYQISNKEILFLFIHLVENRHEFQVDYRRAVDIPN